MDASLLLPLKIISVSFAIESTFDFTKFYTYSNYNLSPVNFTKNLMKIDIKLQ